MQESDALQKSKVVSPEGNAATLYQSGSTYLANNLGKAIECFKKASNDYEHLPSMMALATIYEKIAAKKPEQKNHFLKLSEEYLLKAAKLGSKEALEKLHLRKIFPLVKFQPRPPSISLSFAQQRLWFLEQLLPGNALYNIPMALRLIGKTNITALEKAFRSLIERHEILRTQLVSSLKGDAKQVILPMEACAWGIEKITWEGSNEQLVNFTRTGSLKPFNLQQAPLIRATLLQVNEEESILCITMHHVVSDGWSMGIIMRELSEFYDHYAHQTELNLIPLPIQYADFTLWQYHWLQGEVLESQLNYWQKQLEGIPDALALPTDKRRPQELSYAGKHYTTFLPAELSHRLKELAKTHNATLFMVLLASFHVLLHRYSQQETIVVGSPIANRHHREIEGLVGFFVNALALRADFKEGMSFIDLLEQVRESTLGAYQHQDLPFEHLVNRLQIVRQVNRNPLFQVMFVLQNNAEESLHFKGIKVEPVEIDYPVAKFDLTLNAMEQADHSIALGVEYATDLFEAETIERMARNFSVLLEGIVANPRELISKLPLLTEAERKQLLVDWNQTQADYPKDKTVHQLFEEQVERTPDNVAVVFEGAQLTYRELNEQANQLACYLREQGVTPETTVAIACERSLEIIIGITGILKAGGVCVSIDPSYPAERIQFMLIDAKISVLLTHTKIIEQLQYPTVKVLLLDEREKYLKHYSPLNLAPTAKSHHLAYVIYTSGTTGNPKGVLIDHRSICDRLMWWQEYMPLTAEDRYLHQFSFSFDGGAIASVWRPLLHGSAIVMPTQENLSNVDALIELIFAQQVSVMASPPSLMDVLFDSEKIREASHLRYILVGGEALTSAACHKIAGGTKARIFNLYGPTECTIIATHYEATGQNITTFAAPIGLPLANTQLYILDTCLEPVPIGVKGELYIGGVGLARGYLNLPKETAEKFIESHFLTEEERRRKKSQEEETRIYRTGDLVRYLHGGNIEYLGRLDHQVKIRGFRIECGEIENILRQHSDVKDAVVIAREDESDQKKLVAYVVAREEIEETRLIEKIRKLLTDRLPDYMVPSSFVLLQSLPLTVNGKLDRKALPRPDKIYGIQAYVAPRNEMEHKLVILWAEILKLDASQISIEEDFFNLGGHSLLATQLRSRLQSAFSIELPLRAIFGHRTIKALSTEIQRIQQTQENVLSSIPILIPQERPASIPLSFAQQRLWFLEQLLPGNALYNIPIALRLIGKINITALEKTFRSLIERHEILRTQLVSTIEGNVEQIVLPMEACVFGVEHQAWKGDKEQLFNFTRTESLKPFNLQQVPLIRATLLQVDEEESILCMTMHHVVSDGWSMGIMMRELSEFYNYYAHQGELNLTPLPIQYADFTLWQYHWLQGEVLESQLNYWQKQLEGIPEVLALPTDKRRPSELSYAGKMHVTVIPPELSQGLKELAKAHNATLFMVLLASFQAFLHRYSQQETIVVGSPIANRHHRETEGLIGFFVNTLALRADFKEGMSFVDLLEQVRESTLGAYQHQDLPFEHLVNHLHIVRQVNRNPIFQVMFVLQNKAEESLYFKGIKVEPVEIDYPVAKFDLTLNAMEQEDQSIALGFGYATDLFEAETIERMARNFSVLLEGIVANPQEHIRKLPLLTEAERKQLVVDWNQTHAAYPKDKTIHQLFEEQVERTPDNVAVVFEGAQLTYRELNERANQLAHYVRSQGVKAETLVGISVDRSLELIVGTLGILKAGGAYVPLDPEYPKDRLDFMLSDTRAPLILTLSKYKERYAGSESQKVYLDEEWQEKIAKGSKENPIIKFSPSNLAYVIYTSGSTGKPKGVMVEHGGIVNCTFATHTTAKISKDDIFLAVTSLSFDVAALDYYLPFAIGAKVVIVNQQAQKNPIDMIRMLVQYKVTVMQATPASWQMLVQAGWKTNLNFKILTAGEALSKDLATALLKRGELYNIYGPTEATIYATLLLVKNFSLITIGKPLANVQTYILDPQCQLLPIGVIGELYIGGVGLARGYLNREDLTKEKFISTAFGRLYWTGDLARYLPDGNIEFLGRIDQQVKIRGFRIECGEIESVLRQQYEIKDTVVIAREDEPGQKQLVAYLVPTKGKLEDTQAAQLIQSLRPRYAQHLPDYMVPSSFVCLEKLPLNPNGKLDRKALPKPDRIYRQAQVLAPKTGIEQELLTLLAKILAKSAEAISITDNFFEIGANSLLLAQFYQQLPLAFQNKVILIHLFQYPTIQSLAMFIEQQNQPKLVSPAVVKANESPQNKINPNDEIAIIGMACRLPGADDVEQFWELLRNGKEGITHFTREQLIATGVDVSLLNNPNYVKSFGTLSNIKDFDANFFNIPTHEAQILDPQQRLFLECAWEALETAGCDPSTYEGDIGVFAGSGTNAYYPEHLAHNSEILKSVGDYAVHIANLSDTLATRVAYKFNLTGPAVVVQTACSTSLVAVHMACQSLLRGESQIVLAGGISLGNLEPAGYLHVPGMISSPDGHCRAFDAKSEGTVPGQGMGIVVLKPKAAALQDGDTIYAVIRGSAINNDGAVKVSFTAPNAERQADVIKKALVLSGIHPDDINYLETHGTATTLGDSLEYEGLSQVFASSSRPPNSLVLGAVKTNIGHTDTAAGVAGLIKTALTLYHRQLFPTLHFQTFNPRLERVNTPFYINTQLINLTETPKPLRAGVSSFGVGGTNAHVVLEEAPQVSIQASTKSWHLLTLSAQTPKALTNMGIRLANHLKVHRGLSLADVAYTLQVGRKAFAYRQAVVCNSSEMAISALEKMDALSQLQQAQTRPIVYVFSGQGSQYIGMGQQLYDEEPLFKQIIDECLIILREEYATEFADISNYSALISKEMMQRSVFVSVALFMLQYSMARLLMNYGVAPHAMLGHSQGEYTAACLSGVFNLRDALKLIVKRALLLEQLPQGRMLAVQLSVEEIKKYLLEFSEIDLAVINLPHQVVVAGQVNAIERFMQKLTKDQVKFKLLASPHAFHSRFIEGILPEFKAFIKTQIQLSTATQPYISCMTGQWHDSASLSGEYWAEHLRQPVLFSQCVETLLSHVELQSAIVVEIGPGTTLTGLLNKHPTKTHGQLLLPITRHPNDAQSDTHHLLSSVGKLWVAGANIQWPALYRDAHRRRVPLPTYPFERQRFWIEKCNTPQESDSVDEIDQQIAILLQKRSALLEKKQKSSPNFFATSDEVPGRHGLFLHEKKNSIEKKALFKQVIPVEYNLREAKGEGDCFYDACAQGLNELFGKNEYTIKSLRLLCHEYAVKLDQHCKGNLKHPDNWIAKAFNYDSIKYQEYLANVSYTAEEREAGEGLGEDRLAIWGEPHIDGRILCEKLSVRLHVLEVRENPDDETNKEQAFLASHNLVDHNGLRNVAKERIDWTDKNTLHIGACNLHFVPILRNRAMKSFERSRFFKKNDDIAEQITFIWREFLRVNVDINSSYFELGGDSLTAINLFDVLSKRFKMELKPSLIYEYPTVAKLAEHIHKQQLIRASSFSESSPLVCLQKGDADNKLPLILIHPIGGEVSGYLDLIKGLKEDQPVYAFRALSLDGKTQAFTCIEDMAVYYVKELLSQLAELPCYFLGGASFGGIVAYEMAQQLIVAGKKVGPLFVVDAPCPGSEMMPPLLQDSAYVLEYIFGEILSFKAEDIIKNTLEIQLAFIQEKAVQVGIINKLPPNLEQVLNTWLCHEKAMHSYQPLAYAGDMIFIEHEEETATYSINSADGWQAQVKGKFTAHTSPGNHNSMMSLPNVEKISSILLSHLVKINDELLNGSNSRAALK